MTAVAVAVQGQGPALVLLHAFPLHAGMWTAQTALGEHCTLIMPDLPGFGRSRDLPAVANLDNLAEAVRAAVRRQGFERAMVAGCSLGGYLAFALLRRAPEFVSALALIDTRSGADSPEAKERRYATIERVKREGVSFLREEWPKSALSPLTFQERPAVVDAVRDLISEATPAGVIGALQAMADRPDATPQLASIRVPTVVMHGLDDSLISASEARLMANGINGAKFLAVPGAGHLPNMEQSESVTKALRELRMAVEYAE